MTFAGRPEDLDRLAGATFGVTAPDELRPVAESIVVEMGGEPVWVPEPARPLYHAASTIGVQPSRHAGERLARPARRRGGRAPGPAAVAAAVSRPGQRAAPRRRRADRPGVAGRRGDGREASRHASRGRAAERAQRTSRWPGERPSGRAPPDSSRDEQANHLFQVLEARCVKVVRVTAGVLRTRGRRSTARSAWCRRWVHCTPATPPCCRPRAPCASRWSPPSSSTRSQFGPTEDLARYPRTLDADLAMCESAGVDLVWAPSVSDVYPGGDASVRVDPGPLGADLEGAARPGHFSGVLTVVAKFLEPGPSGCGVLRREGLPAADPDPPDGRRPRTRGGDRRRADRPRAGRAGAVQPQRLPLGRRSAAGACPAAGAVRRTGGGTRRGRGRAFSRASGARRAARRRASTTSAAGRPSLARHRSTARRGCSWRPGSAPPG